MMRTVVLHVLDNGPLTTAAICTLVCGHERRITIATYRKPKRKPIPMRMKCPICTLALGR